jgi:hypothetical protein
MAVSRGQLLLELVPGGAKKDLSAAQARRLLAGVRPKDAAGKTRKRVALELVVDLERLYRRKKGANKELIGLVKATGTELLDLHGIGPWSHRRLPGGWSPFRLAEREHRRDHEAAVGRRPGGVLAGVGQRFLHDPVRAHRNAGRHLIQGGGYRKVDR